MDQTNYWFTIAPYVFISIKNNHALLYNTLDGNSLESKVPQVISLLEELLLEENCGVVLLKHSLYEQIEIRSFIKDVRILFMGDIIDTKLSQKKPIQLLPLINYPNNEITYRTLNFNKSTDSLKYLFEVSIYLDDTISQIKLIDFLNSINHINRYNIVWNVTKYVNIDILLEFFERKSCAKYIICSYANIDSLKDTLKFHFQYELLVDFPVDECTLERSIDMFDDVSDFVTYKFNVTSEEDCKQTDVIIEKLNIKKYKLNPTYIGNNYGFFRENVFLTKEDILSVPRSIKDIFIHQTINSFDFGKINIMANGDIYANTRSFILGNINTHNIYEIIQKELKEGKSWFRIRNQAPCNDCIFQYLCPPPSDYEIILNRLNLCHVVEEK